MSTAAPDEIGRDAGVAYGGKHEPDKWNWGAFLWGGIWALGHRLWAKGILGLLLTLIPLVGRHEGYLSRRRVGRRTAAEPLSPGARTIAATGP